MIARRGPVALLGVIGAVTVLSTAAAQGQSASTESLVAMLRHGGYVMVMRHTSSPRDAPDKAHANPDNVTVERQLDEAGRAGATAFGQALRGLKIPVGDVQTSPTYRAQETVKYAQLSNPKLVAELGDGGQSMQNAGDAQAAWLRERVTRLPKDTNVLLVTHLPNITRAFPAWGNVEDGEMVIVGPDGKGGVQPVGRIKIDEWSHVH